MTGFRLGSRATFPYRSAPRPVYPGWLPTCRTAEFRQPRGQYARLDVGSK
jgi:hypothetical protein